MAVDLEGFDRSVALPPELKIAHIRKAIDYIERETSELVEVYFEQANVFSGLVGISDAPALREKTLYAAGLG